jgi:predicted TIM-barrel fold metal-dependent hydrolase
MLSVADKHENVHVAGDRHAPSTWDDSFVKYAGTWGQDKVLFGTDWPVVPFGVGVRELGELGFDQEAYAKVSRENARKLYRLP